MRKSLVQDLSRQMVGGEGWRDSWKEFAAEFFLEEQTGVLEARCKNAFQEDASE